MQLVRVCVIRDSMERMAGRVYRVVLACTASRARTASARRGFSPFIQKFTVMWRADAVQMKIQLVLLLELALPIGSILGPMALMAILTQWHTLSLTEMSIFGFV